MKTTFYYKKRKTMSKDKHREESFFAPEQEKSFLKMLLSEVIGLIATFSSLIYFLFSDEGSRAFVSKIHPELGGEALASEIQAFQHKYIILSLVVWFVLSLYSYISNLMAKHKNFNDIKELRGILLKQKKELENFEHLKESINIVFKNYMISISNILKFTHNERISLYIIHNNSFVCCVRHSQNPNYNSIGRSHYPLNEGVIGEAWSKGVAFVANLPDARDKKEYIKQTLDRFSIPAETTKNFSMFPRLIFGYRISDDEKANYNAIIIIESNLTNFSNELKLTRVMESNRRTLYGLIKDFQNYIPALARAEEEDM